MDDLEEARKSPYHGIWIVILITIAIPLIFFGIFYPIFLAYKSHDGILNLYQAIAFSTLVGLLFQLSCIIAGLWTRPVQVSFSRIHDLIVYFPLVKKAAIQKYKDDVKEDGLVFLIYFILFLIELVLCVTFFTLFFINL